MRYSGRRRFRQYFFHLVTPGLQGRSAEERIWGYRGCALDPGNFGLELI